MRPFVSLLLSLSIVAGADAAVTRHYGTADGLSNRNVHDILQDREGFIWIATWSGVDRFDGYEFRNYRSFPSDSVKLDNSRIERLALDSDGHILVETYGRRRYRLDSRTGAFTLLPPDEAFEKPDYSDRLRPELKSYAATGKSYTDRYGGLWIIRPDGVDHVTEEHPAFRFADTGRPEEEMHVVYHAPKGEIWTASRDTRIMLFDTAAHHRGNIDAAGRIVADMQTESGVKAYAFMADTAGRVWTGTKSGRLLLLTPRSGQYYDITTFLPSRNEGALRCADIYDIVTDAQGRIWLATFGGGVALAEPHADGSVIFSHKAPFPEGKGNRVRRLLPLPGGLMLAAATDGLGLFDTHAPLSQAGRFVSAEPERSSSLSNNDILNLLATRKGDVYLSAFSGGIDISSVAELNDGRPLRFSHINARTGLVSDPVLSVTEDTAGDLWVVSTYTLARYDSGWHLKSLFDRHNLGREVEFTEADPVLLDNGDIVFGLRGGLLFVTPSLFPAYPAPSMAVTGLENSQGPLLLSPDGTIRLPRGERDIAIHFAALRFDGAEAIRYAWREDEAADWTELGHERTLRLSRLPAGRHLIQIRSTDPYGLWADNALEIVIDVPHTATEIILFLLLGLCALCAVAAVTLFLMRHARRARQRSRLNQCVELALAGSGEGTDTVTRMACCVGRMYPDAGLRAEPVAHALGIPRNDLRRVVKEAIGISLEDFIRLVRIRAACAILEKGGRTVAETAYSCGFRTPQYMSMVFKEHIGMTPGEYVRKGRATEKSCK